MLGDFVVGGSVGEVVVDHALVFLAFHYDGAKSFVGEDGDESEVVLEGGECMVLECVEVGRGFVYRFECF